MFRVVVGTLALLVGASASLSGQPRVARAQLSMLDAAAGLAPVIDRIAAKREPAWIAWTQSRSAQRGRSCCWSDNCEGCWLEGQPVGPASTAVVPPGERPPVALEGDTELVVLVRVAEGRVDRLRTVSIGCPLDAGGLPFYTLTGVAPAQSLAWLENQARTDPVQETEKGRSRSAVSAIALHDVPEADAVLDRLLASGSPETRRQVVTWLGMARGAPGLTRLERLLREATDADVRRRIVTAIGTSRDARARTILLDLAKRHEDARVRGEALVAVARLASRETTALLTEAVDRDPDTEVKKKAVFGISRLPADESVPLLIKVARDNPNLAVRRTAMFWLGQSKDPRAVDFFASVLK
jgi:hypothetical protein